MRIVRAEQDFMTRSIFMTVQVSEEMFAELGTEYGALLWLQAIGDFLDELQQIKQLGLETFFRRQRNLNSNNPFYPQGSGPNRRWSP